MASTLCTRMRLLVTVDNYNHTHEHLFEFGVQHAEIANFTIQRLRNPPACPPPRVPRLHPVIIRLFGPRFIPPPPTTVGPTEHLFK